MNHSSQGRNFSQIEATRLPGAVLAAECWPTRTRFVSDPDIFWSRALKHGHQSLNDVQEDHSPHASHPASSDGVPGYSISYNKLALHVLLRLEAELEALDSIDASIAAAHVETAIHALCHQFDLKRR